MCCVPWTPDVSAAAGLAARSAVPVPDDSTVFAAIQASYPGWRVWRTDDGLAARQGGTPPPGPHARGDTAAELMRGIEYVIRTRASHPRGPAIRLRRSEQAALGTLKAAGAPMSRGLCPTRPGWRSPRPPPPSAGYAPGAWSPAAVTAVCGGTHLRRPK